MILLAILGSFLGGGGAILWVTFVLGVGHKYRRLEKRVMAMKEERGKGIFGSLAQCSNHTEEVLGIVSDL